MKKLNLTFNVFVFLLAFSNITLAQNETSIYFYEEGEEINGIKKGKWKEYYENGSLLAKGKYVDGIKSGLWKIYFENGCIKAEGNYIDGKKQGKWTEYTIYAYSEDYSSITKGNYVDGKKHGKWVLWNIEYEYDLKNLGKTRTIRYPPVEINYVEGKKQGHVIEYYENGLISSKVNFVDDKMQGEAFKYYQNGQINEKVNFEDGKKQGEGLTYYEDGSIFSKGKYIYGKEQGEWLIYYKNGSLRRKSTYIDGNEKGEAFNYYENGAIEIKEYFIDKEQVEKIEYYDNGSIKLKENFIKGKRQGEAVLFYSDGNIKSKATYENYRLHGEISEFHQNGQIRLKGSYFDGKKEGEWFYYLEDGQKFAAEICKSDTCILQNYHKSFIKDIEGNEYPLIKKGGYTYMCENLKVKKFLNGDVIIESKNAKEWRDNCEQKRPTFIVNYDYPELGLMYNGYAVYDKRGLLPNSYNIIIDTIKYKKVDDFYYPVDYANFYEEKYNIHFLGSTYLNSKAYSTNTQKSKAFYVKPDGKIYECICVGGRWWMEETSFPHIDMSFSNSCSTGHDGTFFDDYSKPDWQSYGFYVRGFKKNDIKYKK